MDVTTNNYYLSAYSASAAYQTTGTSTNFSLTSSYLDITGGTVSVNTADKAEVSETANKLLERIRELDIFKIIFPNSDARSNTKSLDQVEDDFQNDFFNFSSSFGKIAEMMGLGGESFTMGLNGTGGMTVNGSGENMASKLQGMFNGSGNETTVARFAVMAARAALVDAKTSVPGFEQAYSQDPVAAIKDNIDSLKELLLGFRTQASDGEMNYGFMRDSTIEYTGLTADSAEVAEEAAEETGAA